MNWAGVSEVALKDGKYSAKMNKKSIISIGVCMAIALVMAACGPDRTNHQTNQAMNTMNESTEPVLGLGELITANFSGEAWLKMLSAEPGYDCNVYNVTFAPGTRNNWHSHTVGQILLCTEGEGWYQEKNTPARRLRPGDVVNIPANTMHWHGAARQSRFTHIGITPKVGENATEWGGPVSDDEYDALSE